jgi:hypothetical protein
VYVKKISIQAVLGGWQVTVKYDDRWPGPFTSFYRDQADAEHHFEMLHKPEPDCCAPLVQSEVA